MNIRRWHMGKIVILWAWGTAILVALLETLRRQREFLTDHVFLGFTVLVLMLVIPLGLTVVTWKWFSGKESRESEPKPERPSRQS